MKHFLLSTLGLSIVLLAATSTVSSAAGGTTGLEVVGQQVRNVITLYRTKYEGDCPGVTMENPKAYFTSQQTPTGKKRRVRIENLTTGFSSTPYTDREYDNGNGSETTKLDFGAGHSSKYFRIRPGENRFAYRITERKNLLESGEFTAIVNLQETVQQRNASWLNTEICANSSVSLETCADVRSARQFVCPNGPVLKTDLLDKGNYYRTVLSNRSEQKIEVEFEHQKYRLYPGEAVNLQTSNSSSHSLSVRYRIKDGTWQSVSVTPAKYMQFREASNSQHIEFVEFNQTDRNSYKFRDSPGHRGSDRW
jgi:hypothetical protein